MTAMTQRYRVSVNLDKCVGSTLCMHFAPGAFSPDEKGQAKVMDVRGESAANILEAAEQCPQCAIVLVDAESDEQVFP